MLPTDAFCEEKQPQKIYITHLHIKKYNSRFISSIQIYFENDGTTLFFSRNVYKLIFAAFL